MSLPSKPFIYNPELFSFMLYSEIAETFEKIEGTTKRLEMTDLLVHLFKKATPEDMERVIYLTQGKVRPDFEGVELGIAEKMAIKAIALAAGVSERDVESLYRRAGDLGTAAEELLKKKSQTTLFAFGAAETEPLTVEKVYSSFLAIARASGEGSQSKKIGYLQELLHLASPLEARYIVRSVTGKLRLGIADMTILDALAIAFGRGKEDRAVVERAYNLYPDLGYIARVMAEEGVEGVKRIRMCLGVPVRPMLAERMPSLEGILVKMGGRMALEYKYDGIRVQGHVSRDEIWLYSRRMENITDQFPDVVRALREALDDEVIVDGEAVPVDVETGVMLPFQVVSHRRGRKYGVEEMAEEIPVCLFLFDIIYLNGEDLTMRPYPERREILEKVVKVSERVRLAHRVVTDDLEEARRFFHRAIEEGCEGVVAKNVGPNSIYRAGAREFLWIKYKRDYKLEMGDTVDLVAVGAFYGRGKRKGTYGALLMAAYNPDRDVFETVCKLGTGFTDEQLLALPRRFEPYVLEHRHPRVDSLIEADVWFEPVVVMEVVGAEITLSPTHTCARDVLEKGSGLAIRFPRFTGKWRDDKSPEDATTTWELVEMYRKQVKRVVG